MSVQKSTIDRFTTPTGRTRSTVAPSAPSAPTAPRLRRLAAAETEETAAAPRLAPRPPRPPSPALARRRACPAPLRCAGCSRCWSAGPPRSAGCSPNACGSGCRPARPPRSGRLGALTAARTSRCSWAHGTVRGRVYGDWGNPTAYLVHGWGGWWQQLSAHVEPLLARGFCVVAFDAPSHGDSGPGVHGRRSTTFLEMAEALGAVVSEFGRPTLVVAHSAGRARGGACARAGGPTRRPGPRRPARRRRVDAARLRGGARRRTPLRAGDGAPRRAPGGHRRWPRSTCSPWPRDTRRCPTSSWCTTATTGRRRCPGACASAMRGTTRESWSPRVSVTGGCCGTPRSSSG